MYTLSEAVPVNRRRAAGDPELTRDQVWAGLVAKANNALPFVPQMTQCDVVAEYPDGLLRDVVYRGEPLQERITFTPGRQVRFERTRGTTLGTILNEIDEDDGELVLRFTFSLEREGLAPGSDEERAYFGAMEQDYRAAVHATLAAIRKVAEQEARGRTMARDVKAIFADIDSMVPDRFVQHLTEDVVFRFGNADPVVGRAAVREGIAQFFTTITGMHHELLAVYQDGDVVTAKLDVTYTRPDGNVVTVPNADILEYEGDLVRDWQIYIDLAPLFA